MYLKSDPNSKTDKISQQLIFSWSLRESKWYFLAAFVLATLIHIAGFSFLVAPSPSHQPSVSSSMFYVLDSQDPKNASLNQWLEAEDPSLFARPSHSPITKAPHIEYNPSYRRESPGLAKMEQRTSHILPPLGPTPGPVNMEQFAPPNPIINAQITGTRIELGGSLAGHRIQTLPPGGLLSSSSTPSSPSIFLAAVGSDGRIRHLFLLYSSGDSEQDRKALQNLLQIRLEPVSTKNDIWGTIAYFWGVRSP